MHIETTIDVARSPSEVFTFMADQDNWAPMDPSLVDVTPRGELAVGRHGTMTRRVTGMRVTTDWEITELEPAARMTMVIVGRGYRLQETTTLASGATGTRMAVVDTLTPTSFFGRFFVAMSGRIVRRDLEKRALRLKALLEA